MTGVLQTRGFLSRGMEGRGQGTNSVTLHIPVPFVGVPGVSGIVEGMHVRDAALTCVADGWGGAHISIQVHY